LWYDFPQVLLGAQTLGKLFFSFFNHGLHRPHGFLPTRAGQGFGAIVTALFTILRKLSECSQRFRAAF
jgi:hypothetical protein